MPTNIHNQVTNDLIISLVVERTLGENPGDMNESVRIEIPENMPDNQTVRDTILWLLRYSAGTLGCESEDDDETK